MQPSACSRSLRRCCCLEKFPRSHLRECKLGICRRVVHGNRLLGPLEVLYLPIHQRELGLLGDQLRLLCVVELLRLALVVNLTGWLVNRLVEYRIHRRFIDLLEPYSRLVVGAYQIITATNTCSRCLLMTQTVYYRIPDHRHVGHGVPNMPACMQYVCRRHFLPT